MEITMKAFPLTALALTTGAALTLAGAGAWADGPGFKDERDMASPTWTGFYVGEPQILVNPSAPFDRLYIPLAQSWHVPLLPKVILCTFTLGRDPSEIDPRSTGFGAGLP